MGQSSNRKTVLWSSLCLAAIAALSVNWFIQTTAVTASKQSQIPTSFTYQGYLENETEAANGIFDFQFSLYDALAGGNQVGTAVFIEDLTLVDGLFTVSLDFGALFDGTPLYLEIAVRDGSSSGDYTTLNPRQALEPAPYALYSGSTPWEGLTDVPAGFADGIDDTAVYTAGVGLELTGDAFALRLSYQLPQGCTADQIVRWDGSSWVCGADGGGTVYNAGTGIALISNTIAITTPYQLPQACANDQIPKWDGTGWLCAVDTGGTSYMAGTGISLISDTIAITAPYQLPQACANDQIPKWDGAGWLCADDESGADGDITAVFPGNGLAGGGDTGDVTLTVVFGGNGSANTVARSDHLHDDRYYTETELQTSGTASVHWNNLSNVPPGFADGTDNDTQYTAGNGLQLAGTEFSAVGSTWANVVIVAQSGGDFTDVQTAVDSITTASASNPYLIWIAPGVYNGRVTLKPHIHLQGAGEDAVQLQSQSGNASIGADAATLVLTNSVSVRDLSVLNNGTGTVNTAVYAPNGAANVSLAQVTAVSQSANYTYGLILAPSAELQVDASHFIAQTTVNDAYGIYLSYSSGNGAVLTATQTVASAMGADYGYGLYNYLGQVWLEGGNYTGRADDPSSLDALGIRNQGDLTAFDVTAVGENGRINNYGLENYGNVTLFGGSFTGRGGTGTTSVNTATGIHNRGPLYAEGVTATGSGHVSRNQGLDVEGGATVLVGGSFTGEGGAAAYGIENFGTGGILTATAVSAIGLNGSSGTYGLYNGGPTTLYGGSFTGNGSGAVFGTYGINNVFTIGVLQADGVTAVAQNGADDVWGLRNWLGKVTLHGGSFTAISGTIAYGIDNDTSNASLTAVGVAVLAENASTNNYGLFNRNTADAILQNSHFTGRGGSGTAMGVYNQGSGSTIEADGITAVGENATTNNYGFRNQNSATTNVTASRFTGDANVALYITSGIVRLGVTQLDGNATRAAGTLTCFQAYDAAFAAYVCP